MRAGGGVQGLGESAEKLRSGAGCGFKASEHRTWFSAALGHPQSAADLVRHADLWVSQRQAITSGSRDVHVNHTAFGTLRAEAVLFSCPWTAPQAQGRTCRAPCQVSCHQKFPV